MKKPIVLLTILAALALCPRISSACMGNNVLLQDDFQSMTANWGTPSTTQSVEGGAFVLKPTINTEQHVLNNGNIFTDMDACVDTKLTKAGPKMDRTYAGLMFWGADYNGYYEFVVSAQGTYSVYRQVGGRSITIIDWTANPAINNGINVEQPLRVVTKGTTATFYLGNAQLNSITGQPPQGGGEIGLVAASGPGSGAVWQFTKLKVTN